MPETSDLVLFDQSLNKYLEHKMMTMENQIRQALARGYCHPDNADKELDAVLIEAMAQEVVKSLTPEVMPGHQQRNVHPTPRRRPMASDGRTRYSEKIKGNRGNHNLQARFDMSDGYLGITQFEGDAAVTERVLLSPTQVQELLDFVGKKKTSRAA